MNFKTYKKEFLNCLVDLKHFPPLSDKEPKLSERLYVI